MPKAGARENTGGGSRRMGMDSAGSAAINDRFPDLKRIGTA